MAQASKEGRSWNLSWQERFKQIIADAFLAVVRTSSNPEASKGRVNAVRSKYPGLPKGHLADIQIKRAQRKTATEGAVSALAITGAEALAPQTGGLAIPASLAATAGGLAADMTYCTKVQLELVADISENYECPFDANDEEDLWSIFQLALGLKYGEEAAKVTSQIGQEAAKKQFRKILRSGIRKRLQDWVRKKAGERVAKFLAEKTLLRLIPIANVGISAWMNSSITGRVGNSAKRLFQARDCLSGHIAKLDNGYGAARQLVLPTIYLVGSALPNQVNPEFFELYALAARRLCLTSEEQAETERLVDDVAERGLLGLASSLKSLPKDVSATMLRVATFAGAFVCPISTGSRVKFWKKSADPVEGIYALLVEVAEALSLSISREDLTKTISDLRS